ncbi:uncharacterized protein DSM5745_00903 [Aspergillus mulundensis]|uniref:Inosine/uridine-preferring nucleoside hydrolase domain-containing protein n=1 Tax=Aspergillus mulundensis TaxID=1810919 RepID=A0A3D8T572_9EURO|nr:hypothetical protein DSM5745_00903 [Aspergillus mulundensis]RDW93581.1 hypothetical protein DSM5745_00903 [Aspergillus mulundensis]
MTTASHTPIPLWLDCDPADIDPGHDDAFAILLAAHHPSLNLLGITTIHGNASLENTTVNATRLLEAIGKPEIPVYPGSKKPFCRPAVHAPNIHGSFTQRAHFVQRANFTMTDAGDSGIDGTELLPKASRAPITDKNPILAMRDALMGQPEGTPWVIATGTLTNIALLFATFPEVASHIKGLSIMGGGVGDGFANAPISRVLGHEKRVGNVTPLAEFNIYCDPEASQSIFSNEILAPKTFLMTLDLTHQVLASRDVQTRVLHGNGDPSTPPTVLRQMLYELLLFFASTYETEFGITAGPPLHDPLAVAAIISTLNPEFASKHPEQTLKFDDRNGERFAVTVVTDGLHGDDVALVGQLGRSVVCSNPTGVCIPRGVDLEAFWAIIVDCIRRADELNASRAAARPVSAPLRGESTDATSQLALCKSSVCSPATEPFPRDIAELQPWSSTSGLVLICLSLQDAPSRSPLAPTSSHQDPRGDAHNDNVNFLRSRVRSPPGPSSSLIGRQLRRRQQILSGLVPGLDIDPMDPDDASMRMSVEINRRIPILRRQRSGPNEESYSTMNNSNLYEGRVSNPRTLYGWAPASDDEEYVSPAYPPIQSNALSSWLGRLSERSTSRRSARRNPQTNPGDAIENSHRSNETGSSVEAQPQSIPRQPRFSRARPLHDYLLERVEDPRDRSSAAASSRAWRLLPSGRSEPHRTLTHNDLRARVSAHRQLHLENPPSPRLKETIRYLDRLRYSSSFEESLRSAAAGGFVELDLLSWDEDDFILDTSSLCPPPECSWLRPGMTFSGCQRAASTASVILPQQASSSSNDPMIVNGNDQNRISIQTTNGRRYLASQVYNIGRTGKDENWPVKVTIHDINTHDMTLSGTMEAYNIPDKTSPSHDAHIVTFLEGEIIDFNSHTLETKNFQADAEIDSTYWRELQPFKDLTDEEMTRNLVSRKWITEELCKSWILMRWKERCFITPTDARQGLTISGFYYISLHRETGNIEGLYYDPGSSPYQQLSLRPETKMMTRPSYNFR